MAYITIPLTIHCNCFALNDKDDLGVFDAEAAEFSDGSAPDPGLTRLLVTVFEDA